MTIVSRHNVVIDELQYKQSRSLAHGRGIRFARSPRLSTNGVQGTEVGGTWTIYDTDNWQATTRGIKHKSGGDDTGEFGAGDFPEGTVAFECIPEVAGVQHQKAVGTIVLERADTAGDITEISLGASRHKRQIL